jgi:hypothetical protein
MVVGFTTTCAISALGGFSVTNFHRLRFYINVNTNIISSLKVNRTSPCIEVVNLALSLFLIYSKGLGLWCSTALSTIFAKSTSGRQDHMVVGFTTTCAISACHH